MNSATDHDNELKNNPGCWDIIVKCLISFAVTYALLLPLTLLTVHIENDGWWPIVLLVIYPILCFFNSFFMFIMYAFGIDRGRITGIPFIITESVLVIAVFSGYNLLIHHESIYLSKYGSECRRVLSSENFQIISTFAFLWMFLWMLKKIFPAKTKTPSG